MKSCRSRGYTLLEMLIAMSLLVLLGGGLVTLLRESIATWNTAENRGKLYEEARAVLDRVADDLRSTVIRSHAAGDDSWVEFLSDLGPGGKQRLRFVRATSGETADSVLRKGGTYLSTRAPAAYDGREDTREADEGFLAAPGGLMEVLYAQDPRPGKRWLWRGVRSPVGGPDSLFIDANLGEERAVRLKAESKSAPADEKKPEAVPGEPLPADEERGFYLRAVAVPVCKDVLFLGFNFWLPATSTWREVPPLRDPKPGQESGPTPFWDSTRAILDLDGDRDEFVWKREAGSLDDPKDDVFPEQVQITLTLGEGENAMPPRLAEELGDGMKTLTLSRELLLPDDPEDRYVLVDDEWIAIEKAEGTKLTVAPDGRGERWTKAVKHDRGTQVELGTTFRRVVEIPGSRPGVSGGAEPARRKGGYRR
jgi:prepilin-type N-terminal cleavage/methylation domain-containing protein